MFAKVPAVLMLIVSLLLASWTVPAPPALTRTEAPRCGEMECVSGCCTSKACCGASQQQRAPETPRDQAPRPELQAVTIDFQWLMLASSLREVAQEFVILEEVNGQHSLPPLALSCIHLI